MSFALGADNQATIKAFYTNLRSPGHHIATEILQMAKQVHKRRSKAKYKLTIRWTAGHEGIEGNEAADREAKLAAEGRSSAKSHLPAYLRKPLLINLAAIKRAYHDTLKARWAKEWKGSPRGRCTTCINDSMPLKRFLGTISQSKLSCEAASRIAQLRLAHAPVNQYLKCIGRVDSARCPACGAEEETIKHLLLTCPAYAHKRWALDKQAKKQHKQLTMVTLLGEQSMAILLANYIDAMHRFKDKDE
jgi:hypothetical protein